MCTEGIARDGVRIEDHREASESEASASGQIRKGARDHLVDSEPLDDSQVESRLRWGRSTDSICVFAPSISLSVTIEAVDREPPWGEIHLHPAGQGFWIARLLAQFGYRALLSGPVGGETGSVLRTLVPHWGVTLRGIRTISANPCYVDDRRTGDRHHLAQDQRPTLRRHEIDDLYGRTMEIALETDVTVVTGRHPEDTLPLGVFERMGADLESMGVPAIGDLHGPELAAFMEGGRLEILKVSDEDLISDGMIEDDSESSIRKAIEALAAKNIGWIVVSRAERGALVGFEGLIYRAEQPALEVVDRSGSGDSMTAALVAAWLRRLDPEQAVRLGCAAGAANVTRRGLGSASAELIEQLAERVRIEPIEGIT